jgi:hypothetical protein
MSHSTKEYRDYQNESGIKVGDRVRVTRKAQNYEIGWGLPWVDDMDQCIGKCYEVKNVSGQFGFKLEWTEYSEDEHRDLDNGGWFPYFVLQLEEGKLDKPKLEEKCARWITEWDPSRRKYRRIILD